MASCFMKQKLNSWETCQKKEGTKRLAKDGRQWPKKLIRNSAYVGSFGGCANWIRCGKVVQSGFGWFQQ